MLTSITIKRVSGAVIFETVFINNTDLVFFINLDTDPDPAKSTHKPEICDDELGPSPPNSSKCTVPDSQGNVPSTEKPPYTVTYKCQMPGHETEQQGTINVLPVLAPNNITLAPATKDQAIKEQQVVKGGKSPYAISGQLFQVTDDNSNEIDSGPGIGPGLQLNAKTENKGITVTGIPTRSGTYNFTFTVDDDIGGNLQQVQYSMKVV
jgi:hypothetical protein